jgi:hypothetical protein
MLKHGAATQFEDADAETRSWHTAQNAETQRYSQQSKSTQSERNSRG